MNKYINKIIRIIILLSALSIVVITSGRIFNYNLSLSSDKNVKTIDGLPDDLYFIPNLTDNFSYIRHDTVRDRYDVFNDDNQKEFYVLLTSPYCDEIRAWGGRLPFAIIVDNDDEIKQLYLLRHSETPSWIEGLENVGFFETWNGMTISAARELEVDAISGSTLTSDAVIRSVKQRLSVYCSVEEEQRSFSNINYLGIISVLIVLIVSLLSFFRPKNAAKFRLLLLLLTVGVLGFWQAKMFSMANFTNWMLNGLDPYADFAILIMLILSIVLPLVTNKSFYCQYVCPYGSLQELAGKIPVKKMKIGQRLAKILNMLKYILLLTILFVIIFKIEISLEDFEPFSAFRYNFASYIVLSIAVLMLIVSVFNNKFWCKYLCPTGAVLGLLRGRIKKTADKTKTLAILVVILSVYSCTATVKESDELIIDRNMNTENETLKTIHNRKSVRSFKDVLISNDTLEMLVRVGMAAPSARNVQPWAFIIINDREILDKLGNELANAPMLKNAAAAIVVCGNLDKALMDPDPNYWVQDCCAASQNILIAAESLGLGAVWTAAFPYEDRINIVRKNLKIPDNLIPLNVIPLGYPDGEHLPKDKWNDEIVFYNEWD
jgi:nitroreductase/Na+-translocating ferredoxin:NAD+ oxidoreductase RnfG subunit